MLYCDNFLSYERHVCLCASIVLAALFLGCSRSERMDTLYLQRCVSCHGASGQGDGRMAALLPVSVPDFRETVERKSNAQMRRIISEGKGVMPAFNPALKPGEINDMVRMVRLLSREGRELSWWEKYDALVIAHCSVPWEVVFGYNEPPETP
ncbi:MAG TPA: cytochrome c [Candidatus Binatia bacterium]|nr:cytochrome c [Candidatus Binatia bacterium]